MLTQKDTTSKTEVVSQILHTGNITSLDDLCAYKGASLDFMAFS